MHAHVRTHTTHDAYTRARARAEETAVIFFILLSFFFLIFFSYFLKTFLASFFNYLSKPFLIVGRTCYWIFEGLYKGIGAYIGVSLQPAIHFGIFEEIKKRLLGGRTQLYVAVIIIAGALLTMSLPLPLPLSVSLFVFLLLVLARV